MSALIHCIYASSAADTFQESDIPALLKLSRKANAARNVTGMLLYIDGSFFQVLEGSIDDVDAVYALIARDRRHQRITMVIREPILERSFGDWTMGYCAVSLSDVGDIVGQNDFFSSSESLAKLGTGRAKKLLAAFHSGRWRTERTGSHRSHVRVA
jgi:Sensors of blue-light using FAD